MLFALVVMAGVVLVVAVFNNRRRPSRSEGAGSGWDGGNTGNGSAWTFGGGSGGDSVATLAVTAARMVGPVMGWGGD